MSFAGKMEEHKEKVTVVDLFAGCGGLSFGFEKLDNCRVVAYEQSHEACETYKKNLKGEVVETTLSTESKIIKSDILIGGPPCQPFSREGNQKGKKDERDMVPIFLQAIHDQKPLIAIMENVDNIVGKRHTAYFSKILSQIEELEYQVSYQVLNFADYGVPQSRKRLVLVAHRGNWEFPPKKVTSFNTVGDTLPKDSWSAKTGDDHPELVLTENMDKYIETYEQKSHCVNSRDLIPSKPARTLTCRNLAGCTSDMIRIKLSDGKRRQLTVPEAAILQTFPSTYFDHISSRTEAMKQIGNAVPPLFSSILAEHVLVYIGLKKFENTIDSLVPSIKRKIEQNEHGKKKKQLTLTSLFAK